MSTSNPGSRPGSRGRARRGALRAVLAVTGAVAVAVGLMAAPAAAQQSCTGAADANVCLSIERLDDGNYAVHIGIDVRMSQQDAQAIIDQPGDPFTTWMMGSDWFDDSLLSLPMTGLGAWEGGLGADFDRVATSAELDEDSDWWDDDDEVFARIWLYDRRSGSTREFRSDTFHGTF